METVILMGQGRCVVPGQQEAEEENTKKFLSWQKEAEEDQGTWDSSPYPPPLTTVCKYGHLST